jgi:hypothetical protein
MLKGKKNLGISVFMLLIILLLSSKIEKKNAQRITIQRRL